MSGSQRSPLAARQTAGALAAEARLAGREVRSYEAEYVGGLRHWDFHHGSRKVLTARGEWQRPVLLGILDDRSRLARHLQWYLAETAENVAHGLAQALQKRGLPRAAMSDNGAAMTAAEIAQGLAHLGILHQTTLPYSPYQNAKQDAFWGPVEGRLMAMLEAVPDLALVQLNEATQAWVEYDYNRKIHSETGTAPIARFLAGPTVMRPCPDSAALKLAFTRSEQRSLRKSDGTIVIAGRRFEVPNRYRRLASLEVRFASWDLSLVHLVDDIGLSGLRGDAGFGAAARRDGGTAAAFVGVLGIDRRTMARWRGWWVSTFAAGPFWRQASAALMPPADPLRLPASLLDRFAGTVEEKLICVLRFLAPITGGASMMRAF